MISLEQVQQLESKVSRAIEYVQKVNAENAALISEREGLQAKLNANQKRIDELEVLVMRFKEDQGRIEDGIVAALDRLSQFEEAFENSLKDQPKKTAAKPKEKAVHQAAPVPPSSASSKEIFFEIPAASGVISEKPSAKSSADKENNPPDSGIEGDVENELDIF